LNGRIDPTQVVALTFMPDLGLFLAAVASTIPAVPPGPGSLLEPGLAGLTSIDGDGDYHPRRPEVAVQVIDRRLRLDVISREGGPVRPTDSKSLGA
jgi:hypothetical protein